MWHVGGMLKEEHMGAEVREQPDEALGFYSMQSVMGNDVKILSKGVLKFDHPDYYVSLYIIHVLDRK